MSKPPKQIIPTPRTASITTLPGPLNFSSEHFIKRLDRGAEGAGISPAQDLLAAGKAIRECVDDSDGALQLGEALYFDISHDLKQALNLDLSHDTIRRIVQFSRNYPQFPEGTPLA
ncbi:MAG: hypothetical protein AB1650_04420 [Candidatus Omnitrophota bacterium]